MAHLEAIRQMARASGLELIGRREDAERWTAETDALTSTPVGVTHSSIDYQISYFNERYDDVDDLSFLLVKDGHTLLAVAGLSASKEGTISLGLDECPVFVERPSDLSDSEVGSLGIFFRALQSGEGATDFFLRLKMGESLDRFGVDLVQIYAVREVLFSYMLDPVETVRLSLRNLRKGHRSAVRSPRAKELRSWLVSSDQDAAFRAFRNLHKEVSGRVTRGDETWSKQLEAVLSRNSLIFLVEKDGDLVGGALVDLSVAEASYAVGVYDRGLMASGYPLGHVVQTEILRCLSDLGIRRYLIGEQRRQRNLSDEKLANIDSFKRGFGGSTETSLLLSSRQKG
jgi:hypothetical protein